MATAKVTYLNGKTAIIPLKEVKNDNIVKMTIAEKLDYSKINYIDFDAERSCAETGDEGYFIALHTGNNDYIDNDICGDGLLDTGLMFFRKRTDMLFVNHRPKMYLYGVKKKDTCFIGIATGLTFQTDFVFEVKNGFYYNYARFLIEGEEPYEEPTIELHRKAECQEFYSPDFGGCHQILPYPGCAGASDPEYPGCRPGNEGSGGNHPPCSAAQYRCLHRPGPGRCAAVPPDCSPCPHPRFHPDEHSLPGRRAAVCRHGHEAGGLKPGTEPGGNPLYLRQIPH